MKKFLVFVFLLSAQASLAGSIRIADVKSRESAKTHVSDSAAFTDNIKREMKTQIDIVKKDPTNFVQVSRLSSQAKTQVSTYLSGVLNEQKGMRITTSDEISEAIAKRVDILADVTLLVGQRDKENLDLIASFANRDQIEIATLVKMITLSKEEGGGMQGIAKRALEVLKKDNSKSALEALKAVGYKSNRLEDFIIC